MKNFITEKIINPLNKLIDKYPLAHQFVKFCMVGATNLIIYLSIYWALTRLVHLHYVLASIGGFIIAVTWSFVMNLKWTFKHKEGDRRKQYVKFFIANIIGLLINLALLSFFIEIVRLHDIVAQLICSFLVAFINFGINRFWTFKKQTFPQA